MNKTITMLLASVLFAAGVPVLHGVASATTANGTVALFDVDIWQLQCNSTLTACIDAQLCDGSASSVDEWWITLDVYAPTTLQGKGATNIVNTGDCAQVGGCRVPPSHRPMKAFVNIHHVAGGSGADTYTLTGQCRDKDGNILPDSGTKLTGKTNN